MVAEAPELDPEVEAPAPEPAVTGAVVRAADPTMVVVLTPVMDGEGTATVAVETATTVVAPPI